VYSESANHNVHSKHKMLSSLRGGGIFNKDKNANTNVDVTSAAADMNSIEVGAAEEDDLTDEDLDEYIEFLLAYADDLASESDNPLFKYEKMEQEYDDNDDDVSVSVVDNNVVEPLLVDDVEDDRQLDAMVDKLVASIDDSDEIEEEQQRDTVLKINLQQETETTLPSIREDFVVEDVDIDIDDDDEELQVGDITPFVQEESLPIEQEEESILVDSIIEGETVV
ncbi:MAG: hypothetical protein ACI90V_012640, partial [Bacillariaceae sp.]